MLFGLPGGLGVQSRPFMAPAAAGNIVSIQPFSITITGATSNTATITEVDATKSVIFWGGSTINALQRADAYLSRCTLTNGTTVTATRNSNAGGGESIVVSGTVVEFSSSFISSVQYGTITLTAATSNTATITEVDTSKSFVMYLGATTTNTGFPWTNITQCAVSLTDATTVTGIRNTGTNNVTISFVVVECADGIINSLQKISDAYTSSSSTDTKTISSVNTANSFIAHGGNITAATSGDTHNNRYTAAITGATTVTLTRDGTATDSRTPYYTVVEFVDGVLNSAPQYGAILLNNVTSNTATITSVDTDKTIVHYTGSYTNENNGRSLHRLTLTDGTTVTANTGEADASTTKKAGFVVLEFV